MAERAGSGSGRIVKLALAAAAAAIVALVIAMIASGAATPRIIPGLPDQGAFTRWGMPLAKLTMDTAGVLTIGALLAATVFLPSDKGLLGKPALAYVKAASWIALVWACAAAATMVFSLSEALGLPVTDVLGGNELTSYASQVSQGIALTLVVLFAVAIALFARGAITVGTAGGLLVLALVTLLPPALTGHSASSPNHDLATTGVAVHLLVLALWVGGLAVLCAHALRRQPQLEIAATRFSAMALWCFIGVGLSGRVQRHRPAHLDLRALHLRVRPAAAGQDRRVRGARSHRLVASEADPAPAHRGQPEARSSGSPPARSWSCSWPSGWPSRSPAPLRPRRSCRSTRPSTLLGYLMPPEISLANLASLWWFDLFSGDPDRAARRPLPRRGRTARTTRRLLARRAAPPRGSSAC